MRDGRAIIPASWVRAATTPSAPQFFPGMTGALFGYGYQTWIIDAKEREFMLRGLRGQGIYVAPKSKIVMVHTAVKNVGVPDVAETLSLWNGVVKSLTAVR
jgi:CubicO group peptidase (beta-lactamase class C family)